MKIKACAQLTLKKPEGKWKDDPGFTDEQLTRITEATGLDRLVVNHYAKFEAIYINHYVDDPIYQTVIGLLREMGRTIWYWCAPEN